MRFTAWLGLLLLGCVGATETNVAPAPCERDDECAPSQRCRPLATDGGTADGSAPTFCVDE